MGCGLMFLSFQEYKKIGGGVDHIIALSPSLFLPMEELHFSSVAIDFP